MTLEEILSTVESDELKTSIKKIVDQERSKGISSYNKKDQEVLKYKNALKDLGYSSDEYDNISSFIDKKKSEKEKIAESSITISSLNDKINSLTSAIDEERKKVAEKDRLAKVSEMKARLTNSDIGKKFYGSSFMIESLINNGKVDLVDNDVVYKNGEETLNLKDAFKILSEEYKSDLKVDQTGGTGALGGKTPGDKPSSFSDLLKAELSNK
jgi:hypothetical protein